MEQSPLVQQQRPEILKPKVVGLYETLFKNEQPEQQAEGFWTELFLLKPDPKSLFDVLDDLSADDLLHSYQIPCQELFHRAVKEVQNSKAPTDENALDTLTVFLDCVLNKRYASPSSEIITILASLQGVDTIFTEYVSTLDASIRDGRTFDVRQKSVRVAVATVSGLYQTGLVSYFINRDLFPSLMKMIYEADVPIQGFNAFALLGLLVNHNKFEFQNPYRLRFEDFVNETAISKVINCVGSAFQFCRDNYVTAQDDSVQGWTLSSTMQYIGLPVWFAGRGAQALPTDEEIKTALSVLPPAIAVTLLSTYDFANANKLFCYNLATVQPENKQEPSCFANFLSFMSYLMQNAHQSERASLYLCLSLLIVQILLEDQVIAKSICTTESQAPVRLCRQRPPQLPLVRGSRSHIFVLLDAIVDGINHNLKKRLDVALYQQFLDVLVRILSFLNFSRMKLDYHWSELWQALSSLLRFLNTYSPQLMALDGIGVITETLTNILAFGLSTGETFLPDAPSHDDLVYKVIQISDELPKLRDNYALSRRSQTSSAIEVLINVSEHYTSLLKERADQKVKSLSPREVAKIIKSGYDTLSIQAKDSFANWERYREVDHKGLLKKIIRVAVQDMRSIASDRAN